MRCFLVNPDYPQRHPLLMPVPPLGIALLAAVLERAGHEVRAEDQFATRVSNDDLAGRIARFDPALLGVGSLTPSIDHAVALVRAVRARGWRGKVVMGNVHPTIFGDDLLAGGACDVVVRGEGDEAIEEVAAALDRGAPLDGIDGISFRAADGTVVRTAGREQLRSIDDLPVPAWHLLPLDRYTAAPMLQVYGLVLPIQGSRGCPERCTFCGQEIFARKMRVRSLDSVMAEIDVLVDRYGVKYFIFVDANFPPSEAYGLEFCRRFRAGRHFGRVKWGTELKVDYARPAMLRAMKDAGCHVIEYGFEVGDPRILASINKRATLADAEAAMRATRAAGICTMGLFMIGLPGEGVKEILRTFLFAQKLDPDLAKFNIAIPLPGTGLFKEHRAALMRDFHPETYSSWYRPARGGPPMAVVPGGLSAAALIRLQALGMLMFYARPRPVARVLLNRTIPTAEVVTGAAHFVKDFFESLLAR